MKRADRMDIISEKWRSTIALSRSFFFFFMNSTMIRFEFLEALSHLIMFSIYNTPFTKSSREERHLIAKTRKLVKLSRRRAQRFQVQNQPPAARLRSLFLSDRTEGKPGYPSHSQSRCLQWTFLIQNVI